MPLGAQSVATGVVSITMFRLKLIWPLSVGLIALILAGCNTVGTVTVCAPTPQGAQDGGPRTPTPLLSEFGTPPAVAAPTVTPLPISKKTDLAPSLAERDKAFVYVMRCRGEFELFLVPPDAFGKGISTTLSLQSGDVILSYAPPASMMGHRPPDPTIASSLMTPTP